VTPLEAIIRADITATGPMPMDRFMELALSHPEHGYYMSQEPFGPTGDFVTAPEISQMFGEMIGLWVASVWQAMGAPERFRLIELGPGRGTLMADLTRALSALPRARQAADIWLVETSPRLRQCQSETLGPGMSWAASLAEVPTGAPSVLIANEFFDAMPVRQAQKIDTVWFERHVVEAEGGLAIRGLPPRRALEIPDAVKAMPDGGIWETSPTAQAICTDLGARIGRDGGAALIIDYGDWMGSGDTMQAVLNHQQVPVLTEPGHADVTAHVRFSDLAAAASPAHPSALSTQADFLRGLGIGARASALAAGQTPARQTEIADGLERLTDPKAMGQLFKVLGLAGHGSLLLPGFTAG